MYKNKHCKVVKNPTPANRSMNKAVSCCHTPTPANRRMNKSVKVSPSK